MLLKLYAWRYKILVLCLVGIISLIGFRYRLEIGEITKNLYDFLTDQDQVEDQDQVLKYGLFRVRSK